MKLCFTMFLDIWAVRTMNLIYLQACLGVEWPAVRVWVARHYWAWSQCWTPGLSGRLVAQLNPTPTRWYQNKLLLSHFSKFNFVLKYRFQVCFFLNRKRYIFMQYSVSLILIDIWCLKWDKSFSSHWNGQRYYFYSYLAY